MTPAVPDSAPPVPWLSRTLRKTFFSLRNRNFRPYFTGQVISNTGNWLTNAALTLLVLSLTGAGSRPA